jgi:hypothetical protein
MLRVTRSQAAALDTESRDDVREGIVRRLGLLVVVLVMPLLVPHVVRASASSPLTVSTVSNGVRLTLTVSRRVYAASALAQVTVQVRNASRHPVWTRIGVNCITWNPSVEVIDDRGTLTSQLPPDYFSPPCPRVGGRLLPPGAGVREHVLVIIGATHISATLLVGKRLNGRVQTPAVTVRLVPGTPPSVAVRDSPFGPSVQVDRPTGATGPLYVEDSAFCHLSAGIDTFQNTLIWTPAPAGPIYPDCGNTQEWHGLAGFLNYPVAAFDYVKPQGVH